MFAKSVSEDKIKLSVVMPAYNEGRHIYENLLETSKVLSTFVSDYEIIVVNDGSKDDTYEQMLKAKSEDSHIIAVNNNINQGKGFTLKDGTAVATGTHIAFLDADLELPPKLLRSYLKTMDNHQCDIVIGSKQHPKSKIHYPFIRKVMSFGYYLFTKILFRFSIHDTQTGIKLFKAPLIKPIMADLQSSRYAFDIEVLAVATKQGAKIVEAPIILNFSREGDENRRIGIKDVITVFTDTLAVKKKIRYRKIEK